MYSFCFLFNISGRKHIISLLFFISTLLAGCGGGITGISESTPPGTQTGTQIPDKITVYPADSKLPVNKTTKFTATATYSNGSTALLGNGVTWTIDDPTIATFDSNGVAATGIKAGSTTVKATVGGVSSIPVSLVVTQATITSIAVSTTTPSIPNGWNAEFVATANFSDGIPGNVTGLVTWKSATPAVASISSIGVATGIKTGNSSISASWGNISKAIALTIDARVLIGGELQGLPLNLPKNDITLAGSGAQGYANGKGTAATFTRPYGITTDGRNLYVADYENNLIRNVVIATGEVSTLAGGQRGSQDGVATAAMFAEPAGITTDGQNLYVADYGNHKIRKVVISTGEVTTLAGGVSGDVDGIGTDAAFFKPSDITIFGNDLYVADYGNNKIRKIVIATGKVTTLAGSGAPGADDAIGNAASFNNPAGITTNGSSLYVADLGNHKIREIVINTGQVKTLAGSGDTVTQDGTGTGASFGSVLGITTDGTNLYVSDVSLRKIVINGAVVTTLGITNASGVPETFGAPHGITTDGFSLYMSDYGNNKIYKIQ